MYTDIYPEGIHCEIVKKFTEFKYDWLIIKYENGIEDHVSIESVSAFSPDKEKPTHLKLVSPLPHLKAVDNN